ncbi:MAG: hypothetical protein M3347_18920 [Armatimonadota bacterium]|nr:hypothetical protein [Armatimonadota bacterium]
MKTGHTLLRRSLLVGSVASAATLILVAGCPPKPKPRPPVRPTVGPPSALSEISADLFKEMDGGIQLTEDEIKGRNNWMIWTADNAKFWDWLAGHSFGTTDLLKMLDSRQRSVRLKKMGVINEPGFKQATAPDENGLWLDVRADGSKDELAGVDPAVYGRSSGVLGLRIFPNPKFDAAAKKNWKPAKYYSDPNYYNKPDLVRPYSVGMACSFCHVSFDPVRPPADPENPEWKNLSAYIGAQYFQASEVFGYGLKEDNFVYQLLKSSPRGTLDTSFIATDHINNPRNMNALYNIAARLTMATEEKLAGGALKLISVNGKERMAVPHVLKDGADSVGFLGALSRVYVNIGEDSDQWLKKMNYDPLVGKKPYQPYSVAEAQQNSEYWQASEAWAGNLAKYFLKATVPHYLEDAPGGKSYITTDQTVMTRGKIVFAENCASCHSSKQPPANIKRGSKEYLDWMRTEVQKPDFRENNYLSDDKRYPVTEIQTNAASPLARNALRGQIWDNFSSETYKTLPSVGQIEVEDPLDATKKTKFTMPGGGRGFQRTPTLVSIWASAPFFHNNMLGKMNEVPNPSVAGRMKEFNDAVEKLLWPEKRLGRGSIWRTSTVSYLQIPRAQLPLPLRPLADGAYLRLGPIPAGTPVNLLGCLDTDLSSPAKTLRMLNVVRKVKNRLLLLKAKSLLRRGRLSDAEVANILKPLVPDLLRISTCPDFVEDRGHYYGTKLPDSDKKALIEFLKTL